MKSTITKTKSLFFAIAMLLVLFVNAATVVATTIVGWDFASLNSTLGTTGIVISSVNTNGAQTQAISGGFYGSFKRISSSVDGLFEINFSGVTTTAFTITSLSMDINSTGAIMLGGNFQVQMQHSAVNGGAFTNVGSLIPYGFSADQLTVNFVSDLSAVTSYNNLTGVAVKILFTVFGPNSKTIKIDNLMLNGVADVSTGFKTFNANGISFDGKTIFNPKNTPLQVFDLTGKLLEKSNVDVSLQDYKPGIYMVRSGNLTFKFVVSK